MTDTVTHKRATVRPDKGGSVAELTTSFEGSAAAVLTEYRGLTVKQLKELRRALGADTTFAVVKNTLTKIAATRAGLTGLDDLLAGPTAVAFVKGDPVSAAKSLRDFAKANPALVVKGGVMDGKSLTAEEFKKLADLESREVLLAKLAGAMKASLTQAVYLFAAPLSQAARAFGALEAKGGAGTAPAPEEVAVEVAVDTAEETVEVAEAPEAPADATEEVAVEATSEASTEATETPDATTEASTASTEASTESSETTA